MVFLRTVVLSALVAVIASSPTYPLFFGAQELLFGDSGHSNGLIQSLLRPLGILAKGVNNLKCGNSANIFIDISNTKCPQNWDDGLDIIFGTSVGVSGVLDGWIPNLGTIFGNMIMAIFRIEICVLDSHFGHNLKAFSRNVCEPDYGKKWGCRRFNGKFNNRDDIINHYDLDTVWSKLEDILQKHEQEWKSVEGSPQVLVEEISQLTDIFKQDSKDWSDQVAITAFVKLTTVLGALGNCYHPNLGSDVVDGFVGNFIDLGRKCGWDLQSHIVKIKNIISRCDRHRMNEALHDCDDTDYDKYKNDQDVNAEKSSEESNEQNTNSADGNNGDTDKENKATEKKKSNKHQDNDTKNDNSDKVVDHSIDKDLDNKNNNGEDKIFINNPKKDDLHNKEENTKMNEQKDRNTVYCPHKIIQKRDLTNKIYNLQNDTPHKDEKNRNIQNVKNNNNDLKDEENKNNSQRNNIQNKDVPKDDDNNKGNLYKGLEKHKIDQEHKNLNHNSHESNQNGDSKERNEDNDNNNKPHINCDHKHLEKEHNDKEIKSSNDLGNKSIDQENKDCNKNGFHKQDHGKEKRKTDQGNNHKSRDVKHSTDNDATDTNSNISLENRRKNKKDNEIRHNCHQDISPKDTYNTNNHDKSKDHKNEGKGEHSSKKLNDLDLGNNDNIEKSKNNKDICNKDDLVIDTCKDGKYHKENEAKNKDHFNKDSDSHFINDKNNQKDKEITDNSGKYNQDKQNKTSDKKGKKNKTNSNNNIEDEDNNNEDFNEVCICYNSDEYDNRYEKSTHRGQTKQYNSATKGYESKKIPRDSKSNNNGLGDADEDEQKKVTSKRGNKDNAIKIITKVNKENTNAPTEQLAIVDKISIDISKSENTPSSNNNLDGKHSGTEESQKNKDNKSNDSIIGVEEVTTEISYKEKISFNHLDQDDESTNQNEINSKQDNSKISDMQDESNSKSKGIANKSVASDNIEKIGEHDNISDRKETENSQNSNKSNNDVNNSHQREKGSSDNHTDQYTRVMDEYESKPEEKGTTQSSNLQDKSKDKLKEVTSDSSKNSNKEKIAERDGNSDHKQVENDYESNNHEEEEAVSHSHTDQYTRVTNEYESKSEQEDSKRDNSSLQDERKDESKGVRSHSVANDDKEKIAERDNNSYHTEIKNNEDNNKSFSDVINNSNQQEESTSYNYTE